MSTAASVRRGLRPELLDSLIEGVYEAVLDEDHWDGVAELLRASTDSLVSAILCEDQRFSHVVSQFGQTGVPQPLMDLYVRELFPFDVMRNAARERPEGSWVSSEEVALNARFRNTELNSQIYRVLGIDRVEGIPLWKRDGLYVTMSLNFHRSTPLLTTDEIRALTVLGGHLARAARLQSELWRRGARLGALLELVDRVAWGVVLLDPRRRIVHANPEARRLAAEGDGIAFTGGQLVAVDARDAAALRAAIAGAVGGESFSGPARGDLLLLSRAPHRRPLEVAITPLPLDGASERSRFRPLLEDLEHPAAAILLADPERSADGFAGALTRLYQLTPAEASIAAGIAKGSRISAIALERGVSEQTVRSQIKSVFEKTDTTSQGELAAMLAASLQRYVLGAV